MEMHIYNKVFKKGQSLVEVTVALSILVIVLTSTITLIVAVLNLTLSSRNRTEAITYAQRAISEGKIHLNSTCSISEAEGEITDILNIDDDFPGKNVYLFNKKPSSVGLSADFPDTQFRVLEASVSWEEKGVSTGPVTIRQVISL